MKINISNTSHPTHTPVLDNISLNNNWWRCSSFVLRKQEDYDRLRILSYPGTDVFLLCFSVVCESSLLNVEERWMPELRSSCGQEVPVILVGTKTDLRNDEEILNRKERIITKEEGRRVANRIHAHRYMECSALNQTGLAEIFTEAILSVLAPDQDDKTSRCCKVSWRVPEGMEHTQQGVCASYAWRAKC